MAPVNDLIANAIPLTLEQTPTRALPPQDLIAGTTVAATFAEDSTLIPFTYRFPQRTAPGAGSGQLAPTGPSVWYSYTAPPGGDETVTVWMAQESGFAAGALPVMEVYPGPPTGQTTVNVSPSVASRLFSSFSGGATLIQGVGATLTFLARAGQTYYLYVGPHSSTTSAGTFGFYFFKAPRAFPPGGSHWKGSNVTYIGEWDRTDTGLVVPDITNTAATSIKIPENQAANSTLNQFLQPYALPGMSVAPWLLHLNSDLKYADTVWLLAVIAYTGSNSVTGITSSSGSQAWQHVGTLPPFGTNTPALTFEIWMGKVASDSDPLATFTATFASAVNYKVFKLYAFAGLDPTAPVAGTDVFTTRGNFTLVNHNFDMGSILAAGRKGCMFVLWYGNAGNTGATPSVGATGDVIDSTLPGWVSGSSGNQAIPGFAKIATDTMVFNPVTGTSFRGRSKVLVADFRPPPHPSWCSGGVRNVGFVSGAVGTQIDYGIFSALLTGAPQS